MHASGVLRWYLAVILWCFAVRGSYVAEGTTLRYHRNIGNDREAVPSARNHQAISSDKEVERATDSGTMHDRNNTQSKNHNTIGTTTPRSTISNYYQDRSNSNEVVPGRNKTTPGIFRVQRDLTDDKRVPTVQEPTVLRSGTTSEYYKGKGERDPIEVKSGAKHTVRGWYLAESTTLRYHRNIGNDREVVPSARYHQAISSDKEVERATESGTMHLHDRNSTQLPKDNTIGTTIPRSTTSSYYQDRSNCKEAVPGRNNTTPAMFTVQRVSIDDRMVPVREPTVLRSGTTSGYYKVKGERDVKEAKIEANNTKRQDVIKGTTFGYMATDLLEGTTEHGERVIVDSRDAGGKLNTTSQDLRVSGRKIKMPRPNSQTMQYLLVPGFLMAGILPWVMPKLQMVAMMLSMVNNMAFTSALFTLIRNFIFERESAQHVLYINNGYKKKNKHRNNDKPYKEHQHHAPIYYEPQHPPSSDHHDHSASQVHHEYQDLQEHQEYHQHPPSSDHHVHSASQVHHEYQDLQEHQEYHQHPPGLDHLDYSASQVQYEHLQEHPPIRWENQGVSKFSEKWRRSGSTI